MTISSSANQAENPKMLSDEKLNNDSDLEDGEIEDDDDDVTINDNNNNKDGGNDGGGGGGGDENNVSSTSKSSAAAAAAGFESQQPQHHHGQKTIAEQTLLNMKHRNAAGAGRYGQGGRGGGGGGGSSSRSRDRDRDKSNRTLTEAEKSLLQLQRIDRERERERNAKRDRKDGSSSGGEGGGTGGSTNRRRDRSIEDWTNNFEKAMASVLNTSTDRTETALDSDEDGRNDRKRKRITNSNNRNKKTKLDDDQSNKSLTIAADNADDVNVPVLESGHDQPQPQQHQQPVQNQTMTRNMAPNTYNYQRQRADFKRNMRPGKDDGSGIGGSMAAAAAVSMNQRRKPIGESKTQSRARGSLANRRNDISSSAGAEHDTGSKNVRNANADTSATSVSATTATVAVPLPPTQPALPAHQQSHKDEICSFFLQGKCHKNDDCLYSHDANPPLKMELCKFYLMSECVKRSKCLYLHEEFPCKFYHMGMKCAAGDNCRFAHGCPLPENLKAVLLKHIETVPKEYLGDFPRLTKDGAFNMLNNCQTALRENKTAELNGAEKKPNELNVIPSLFDLECSIPPGFRPHIPPPNIDLKKKRPSRWDDSSTKFGFYGCDTMSTAPPPPSSSSSSPPPQPPLMKMPKFTQPPPQFTSLPPPPLPALKSILSSVPPPPLQTPITVLPPVTSPVSSLPPPLPPPVVSQPDEPTPKPDEVMETDDVRAENECQQSDEAPTAEQNLSNLPPKQRELFLRILERQKESVAESTATAVPMIMPTNETPVVSSVACNDEDWYSSDDDDDDNDNLCISMLNDDNVSSTEPDSSEMMATTTATAAAAPITTTTTATIATTTVTNEPTTYVLAPSTFEINSNWPTSNALATAATAAAPILPSAIATQMATPPVDFLSKIDLSGDVTRLLSTLHGSSSDDPLSTSSLDSLQILPTSQQSQTPNENQRVHSSIYDDVEWWNINGSSGDGVGGNVTTGGTNTNVTRLPLLLPPLPIDLGTDVAGADADAIKSATAAVDFNQFKLQLKSIENYTPAMEIDASLKSSRPIVYKVPVVDIPKPSFRHLKVTQRDPIVRQDPRLRRIFRIGVDDGEVSGGGSGPVTSTASVPNRTIDNQLTNANDRNNQSSAVTTSNSSIGATASGDSPRSPPPAAQQSFLDPRRRAHQQQSQSQPQPQPHHNKDLAESLTTALLPNTADFAQQLDILKESNFYKTLSTEQKEMISSELMAQITTGVSKDPLLAGMLSSLGLGSGSAAASKDKSTRTSLSGSNTAGASGTSQSNRTGPNGNNDANNSNHGRGFHKRNTYNTGGRGGGGGGGGDHHHHHQQQQQQQQHHHPPHHNNYRGGGGGGQGAGDSGRHQWNNNRWNSRGAGANNNKNFGRSHRPHNQQTTNQN